jgi:hypothetical protein
MANVLNEFLHGISKGFQDAAFASFSRRRSTVREDIGMSFSTDLATEEGAEGQEAGQSYLDMLNAPDESTSYESAQESAPSKKKSSSRGRKKGSSSKSKKGVVDSGSKSKRGRKPKKSSGDSDLTTL